MTEYLLADIICQEFIKVVDKGQHKTGKAMHIGFGFSTENEDQYRVAHLYIFAPMNYVYVAVQEERIDAAGKRHAEKMKLLCYHDSCWRNSIQEFIFKSRMELNVFKSFKHLCAWYDILELSNGEISFLDLLDKAKCSFQNKSITVDHTKNPFNTRSLWKE